MRRGFEGQVPARGMDWLKVEISEKHGIGRRGHVRADGGESADFSVPGGGHVSVWVWRKTPIHDVGAFTLMPSVSVTVELERSGETEPHMITVGSPPGRLVERLSLLVDDTTDPASTTRAVEADTAHTLVVAPQALADAWPVYRGLDRVRLAVPEERLESDTRRALDRWAATGGVVSWSPTASSSSEPADDDITLRRPSPPSSVPALCRCAILASLCGAPVLVALILWRRGRRRIALCLWLVPLLLACLTPSQWLGPSQVSAAGRIVGSTREGELLIRARIEARAWFGGELPALEPNRWSVALVPESADRDTRFAPVFATHLSASSGVVEGFLPLAATPPAWLGDLGLPNRQSDGGLR